MTTTVQWHPIGTAPRDRPILLCSESRYVAIAWWSDEFVDAHDADWGKVGAWVVYDSEDPFYSVKFDQPKWWAELPTGPAGEAP